MPHLAITSSVPLVLSAVPRWEINDDNHLVLALLFGGGHNHAMVRLSLNMDETSALAKTLTSGSTALAKRQQRQ